MTCHPMFQVRAMQAANKGLKTAFKSKDLDIDKIEALQEEMADLMDMNTEIQESLARQYAVPDDLDEEVTLPGVHGVTIDCQLSIPPVVPCLKNVYLSDRRIAHWVVANTFRTSWTN